MGDIFAIALVAVIAATLYELRWAVIGAILVYAFFRLSRHLIEQWKGCRDRSRYDRAAILARADRQHREVMAGDDHGVYGTNQTQIVFRDVAASLAEETGGFTRPIPMRTSFRPASSHADVTEPLSAVPYPETAYTSPDGPPLGREFPLYPKPTDWDQVIDLDATDRLAG